MWINELLYVLMITALMSLVVMAVLVNVKISRSKRLEQKETTPKPDSWAVVEPEHDVVGPEPEPEPVPRPETESGYPFNLGHEQVSEPEPEYVFEPELEPSIEPEPSDEVEPEQVVEIPELHTQPEAVSFYERETRSQPEDQCFEMSKDSKEEEEAADLEMPFYFDIPKGSIDEAERVAPGEPWYVPEEPVEDAGKGKDDDVTTCPHCYSQVPKTVYCIYCGNPLKPNPLVEEP